MYFENEKRGKVINLEWVRKFQVRLIVTKFPTNKIKTGLGLGEGDSKIRF